MFGIQEYIIAGLATTVIGGYLVMDKKIDNRDIEILELKNKTVLLSANYNTCSSSLESQNKAIIDLASDYNKTMVELDVWKNKPEKIRYEIVYKTISKDVNLSSERCEDVKNIVDSLGTINYDSL